MVSLKSPIIMHVDMDAFYASVEQADHPELRGRPVIVGGRERGVVSAASYEARKFGVHSAMPMFLAVRRCPDAVVLPVRMDRYVRVSERIMEVLDGISPVVEQVSIDEAYLDLSGMHHVWGDPVNAAEEAKRRIREVGGVTCSVGIASLKFLSKIACGLCKPDGLTCVPPEETHDFIASLPVRLLPGVGKRALAQLELLGVVTAGDLPALSEAVIRSRFGKWGERLLRMARGEEEEELEPVHRSKSVSAENTFGRDVLDPGDLRKWILHQSERVAERLRRKELKGRTVTLKLKRADFTLQTRSRTLAGYTDETAVIFRTALTLLEERPPEVPLRLTGVGVSGFQEPSDRYFWEGADQGGPELEKAVDRIRDRYGRSILRRAGTLECS